ncbi:MAG: hypothetical protein HWE16_08275 [Gammaproteobacteria bacterium]|nr:hypothetical protein [Gammaproteobacteria bacterium]
MFNKIKILVVIFSVFALQACGTFKFQPQEYPLRDGLIPQMKVVGNVKVSNVQESKEPTIVYSYGGSKLESNYFDITEVMVNQARKELIKNGEIIASPLDKSIDLKVNFLESQYKVFHWKSEIRFTVTLGNGDSFDMVTNHGSGVLQQDLNGCIAEAVMNLFKNQRVRDYLAQE